MAISHSIASAAAFGGRPPDPPSNRLRLIRYTPVDRGGLIGTATIELPIGLTIFECPVCRAPNGRIFVNLPGAPMVGADGTVLKDAAGKRQYKPLGQWRKDLKDKFTDTVLDAIRAQYPDALPAGGTQ